MNASANGGAVLEVSALCSHYGRIQALHGVSVKVAKGALVALVGANGAGKTTLLRTISGVQPASEGKILFCGEDITRLRSDKRVRLGIAQVPEGRQVFGPMPVEEALERLEEMRLRAETNRRFEIALLEQRAQLEAMRGRFEVARDLISQAKTLAKEHGLQVLFDSHTAPAAGSVELLEGDAAAAERELRPACEGLERVGELGFLSSVAPLLVEALFAQGRDEEALILTERWPPERLTVPEDADAQVGWRRVRAKLLARRGDFEEAERLGREATAIVSSTDFLDLHAHALADLAEVLRLAGKLEESAAAVQEAIRLYERKGNIAAVARLVSASVSGA